MESTPVNKIFVDLSETLISSIYCATATTLDNIRNQYYPHGLSSDYFSNGEEQGYYLVYYRPGFMQLMKGCYDLVGLSNTHIITHAEPDYVDSVWYYSPLVRSSIYGSLVHNTPPIIHLRDMSLDYSVYSESNNIIINDESYNNSSFDRIRKSLNISPENHIQINPFDITTYSRNSDREESYIRGILDKVNSALKTSS